MTTRVIFSAAPKVDLKRKLGARPVLLSIAIADIILSYVLYSNSLYLSAPLMGGLLALAAISFFLFAAASSPGVAKWRRGHVAAAALSAIIAYIEISSLQSPPNAYLITSISVAIMSSAVSVVLVHYSAKAIHGMKAPGWRGAIIAMLAASVVIGIVQFYIIYGPNGAAAVPSSDEVAYNYYAASLFLKGADPYAHSMAPILVHNNMTPTAFLNGTYEYGYDYPPGSFLLALPFTALPLGAAAQYLLLAGIVVAVFSALAVYHRSNMDGMLILPMAVWFFAITETTAHIAEYLPISVLLLAAYMERARPVRAGVLLGIAAATTQLVWIVLPLFGVLVAKEGGSRRLAASAGYCALSFLAIAGYFIAASPTHALPDMLQLFNIGALFPSGVNLGEFLTAFYPVPTWYYTLAAAAAYASMLLLLYERPDSMRMLLPAAPFVVFFLSLRNESYYVLPFVPLLFAVCFNADGHAPRRSGGARRAAMRPVVFALAIALAAVAIIAHTYYVSHGTLEIGHISPGVTTVSDHYSTIRQMSNISIMLTNSGSANETVSLFIVSSNPPSLRVVSGPAVQALPPNSTYDVTVEDQLPYFASSTAIEVVAFSPGYVTSKTIVGAG